MIIEEGRKIYHGSYIVVDNPDLFKCIRLPQNTFTKSGTTFSGWSTSKIGTVVYTDGQNVTDAYSWTAGETKTLYAVWADGSNSASSDASDAESSEIIDTSQKTTKIAKVTAKKKAVTVSWKKKGGNIKGYEIQCSTDKDFANDVKTVTVNKAKTTSKTIKKLKSGKNYYIRVRTFSKKSGEKVYSKWS